MKMQRKILDEAISLYNSLRAKIPDVDFYNKFHNEILVKYINCEENKEATILIYKELLRKIKGLDEEIYREMHKGVPFFFIGWYSFLIENYDQAIFYLDAAIAEDKVRHKKGDLWKKSGAALFFTLSSQYLGQYKKYSTVKPITLIETDIKNFKDISELEFSIDNFVSKFVANMLEQNNTALLTTLYSFIFEKPDILEMSAFRGARGGTIEPMIMHLFKGALVFESLLKLNFPSVSVYDKTNKDFEVKNNGITIGNILRSPQFEEKYKPTKYANLNGIKEIIESPEFSEYGMNNSFITTARLRNATAHSLSWDDMFLNNYLKMYNHIVISIFYVIYREYIQA